MGKHSKELNNQDNVDVVKSKVCNDSQRVKDKSSKTMGKRDSSEFDGHKSDRKRKKYEDKNGDSNGHSMLNRTNSRGNSNKDCDHDRHSAQRSRKDRHDSDSDSYSSKHHSSKTYKRRSGSRHGRSHQYNNDSHDSHHDSRKHRRNDDCFYDPNKKIKQEAVTDDETNDAAKSSNKSRTSSHSRRNAREHKGDKVRWGKSVPKDESSKNDDKKEKEKPNFGLSGKLAEDTNMYNGVVIKYNEPAEAKKPKRKWRLYVFKGEQSMPTLFIHRQSAYLIGRDRRVVDLPVDHPSCSKQHSALQYRLVTYMRDDGSKGKRIRPYIIDLESANGTFVNNQRIEPRRYVELFEKDVLKFGYSSREYVLLHEDSAGDGDSDDNIPEEDPNMETELPEQS